MRSIFAFSRSDPSQWMEFFYDLSFLPEQFTGRRYKAYSIRFEEIDEPLAKCFPTSPVPR